MATIENFPKELSNKNNQKYKKSIPTIDMTPMVDLGFLLITFFIFTAALSQQNAMDIIVPANDGTIDIEKKGVLNILCSAKKAFVYEGDNLLSMQAINYNNIRKIIIEKKNQAEQNNYENKFIILIKPTNEANYQQVVNILDEMTINEIHRYALVDANPKENQLLTHKIK